jgi:hypothetical protein
MAHEIPHGAGDRLGVGVLGHAQDRDDLLAEPDERRPGVPLPDDLSPGP